METKILKTDEKIAIALRKLYQSYGYSRYKVSKFEEYDLYMKNKKFLMSEQVLTFSDTNGRLMALKPDITLSIIKNTKEDEHTKKVYYTENVYRVPRNAYGFQEIMQTGLEYIGIVDTYAMGEVLMLAAESLSTISSRYVLDISDMGIILGILEREKISDESSARILRVISEKNIHELSSVCRELRISLKTEELLKKLISVYGPIEETLTKIAELDLPAESLQALNTLKSVQDILRIYDIKNINIDFSVVNDMDYYNGLIFKGFIDGIPYSVLSGGRYDNLMERMGKSSEAIGFAVYLDQLEHFMESRPTYDVDTLVIYEEKTDQERLISKVKKLKAEGCSVRVQRDIDPDIRYRQVVYIDRREDEKDAAND